MLDLFLHYGCSTYTTGLFRLGGSDSVYYLRTGRSPDLCSITHHPYNKEKDNRQELCSTAPKRTTKNLILLGCKTSNDKRSQEGVED